MGLGFVVAESAKETAETRAVRILDRYILAEWAKVFALSMLSFMGLLLLSEGYNWIPDFLGWGASIGTIVAYLLLGLVKSLSMLIPISLLISVIFVLARARPTRSPSRIPRPAVSG
ncbi:MAG: LptF/LptG family permease [Verrucomicrobia bacterium]|nr:LptF/LptG family permease [Verrucomicrobiota bacterium]